MDKKDDVIKNLSESLNKLAEIAKKVSSLSTFESVSKFEERNGIDIVKEDFNHLLNELCNPTKKFEIVSFLEKLDNYLNNNHRLLYSEFTNRIINYNEKNDQKVGIIISNLENCIEYSMNRENDVSEDIKKALIKLWDHANLASNQYNYFMTTDDMFINKVEPIIAPAMNELKTEVKNAEEKLEKSSNEVKDIKSKLISDIIAMISIFVGIAFVMFGGMSLLNSLFDFSGMQSIPVNELLCLGSLIGIVIIAAIYAFMIFILRLTNKDIKGKSLLNKVLIFTIVVLIGICGYTYFKWEPNTNNVNENPVDQQITEITETVPEQSQPVNINIYELR